MGNHTLPCGFGITSELANVRLHGNKRVTHKSPHRNCDGLVFAKSKQLNRIRLINSPKPDRSSYKPIKELRISKGYCKRFLL